MKNDRSELNDTTTIRHGHGHMVRVIKVGGSLLEFDLLPTRLSLWLKKQPPAHNVLIAGGGAMAEAVRAADRRFALGELVSHRLCLDVMRVTADLLGAVLTNAGQPVLSVTRGLAALQLQITNSTASPLTILFDAGEFMQKEDANFANPLPQCWDVTSDSIAARIATLVTADELVLLKSGSPPECSRDRASETGFVDRFFSQASKNVPIVRVANLRSAALEEMVFL